MTWINSKSWSAKSTVFAVEGRIGGKDKKCDAQITERPPPAPLRVCGELTGLDPIGEKRIIDEWEHYSPTSIHDARPFY